MLLALPTTFPTNNRTIGKCQNTTTTTEIDSAMEAGRTRERPRWELGYNPERAGRVAYMKKLSGVDWKRACEKTEMDTQNGTTRCWKIQNIIN